MDLLNLPDFQEVKTWPEEIQKRFILYIGNAKPHSWPHLIRDFKLINYMTFEEYLQINGMRY